jgi:hypothetical protein
MSLNNLAPRLAEAGRRAEALATAQETVDLDRELTALNRDAHVPDLARSLTTLARQLQGVGQHFNALAAAREAAQLYHLVRRIHGDVYADDVSRAERLVASLTGPDDDEDDPGRPFSPQ